jgi:hypothetical protein
MGRSKQAITRLLALISVLVLIIAGCRQSAQTAGTEGDAGVTIELILPDAPVMGESVLGVRLAASDGAPVAGAVVEVRGDMAHAGMVPVIATAAPTEVAGEYAAPFDWTMAGDWIVTVTATLADDRVAADEFHVTVGAAE